MDIAVRHKEIPLKTFLAEGKINDLNLINELKEEIIFKCNKIEHKQLTNVKANFSGFQSLINSINFHKFIKLISKEIEVIYNGPVQFSSVWGNILETDEHKINIHNHVGNTAFCGILYLTEDGPGTFFPEYNMHIKETIGKFLLFHPMILHYVPESFLKKQRITLAFNADEVKPWDIEKFKKEAMWIK
jgi:hypothetical protein